MISDGQDAGMINLRVKTVDEQCFTLQVSIEASVAILKEKIKTVSEIAEDRQRLIYRGKVRPEVS